MLMFWISSILIVLIVDFEICYFGNFELQILDFKFRIQRYNFIVGVNL
jgi:hypothetical protein